MRRLFRSNAGRRDGDQSSPLDRRPSTGAAVPGARSIDWDAFFHAFTPTALRDRAIAVDVETNAAVYDPGAEVAIRIRMHNRLPVPVTIVTDGPVRWWWAVDGLREASRVAPTDESGSRSTLSFARGERKVFERRWPQLIRVSDRRWEPVDPGTYTISVAVNVGGARARGLADETTVTIAERES